MTRLLLAAAVAVLVVALVGSAADLWEEGVTDVLAVAGLGLLALGQGIRAWAERNRRSLLVLLLVLALIAVVLAD